MHINTQLYLHLGRYNLTSSSAVVDVLVAVVVVVGVFAAGSTVDLSAGTSGMTTAVRPYCNHVFFSD